MAIRLDIPAVIQAKAPNLHLPGFVIRYLERIVHVKQMNRRLELADGLEGYDFIRHILDEEFHISVSIEGKENIPQTDEPLIFVSNHPLGGMDGIIELLMIGENRPRPLKAIVTDFLMFVKPLACLFVPVNKVGAQSRDYAKRQEEMWQSGCDVLSFPAGMCSRRQRTGKLWPWFKIEDLDWKKSIVQKSQQHQRNIVPIRFEGVNSRFFYALAYWRKIFRLPNIEMLYLVDELYKASGKHFVVHVGKPISWQTFDNTRTPAQWAEYLKQECYKLK